MLPRKHRLGQNEKFKEVFRSGRFVKGYFISLKKSGNGLSFARVGFVVGQKVAKKAVDRNKIKRRLSSAAEEFIESINKGVDVVLLPTNEIVGKKYEDVKEEIRNLFKRARLL